MFDFFKKLKTVLPDTPETPGEELDAREVVITPEREAVTADVKAPKKLPAIPPDPPRDFNARAADLARKRESHTSDAAERERLEAHDRATASELSAAEAEFRRLSDPVVALDASAETKDLAVRRFQAAREARLTLQRDLGAFQHSRQSLADRAICLRQEAALLYAERLQSAHRDDAVELVQLGLTIARIQARVVHRLVDATRCFPEAEALPDGRVLEKRAGLPDFSFPPGTWELAGGQPHVGENLMSRTVWRDHVLVAIGERYPELLPSECADILGLIEDRRRRGAPRWFAQPFSRWDVQVYKRPGL